MPSRRHQPISRRTLCAAAGLGLLGLPCAAQPRLSERSLADIARMAVPVKLENEDRLSALVPPSKRLPQDTGAYRDDLMQRLTFGFSSIDLWASMGSVTRYRQRLIVSVMAPDASDADYATPPGCMAIALEGRRPLGSRALGTGMLSITVGTYALGSESEPAWQFLLADRARRLQLVWHALQREIDLETGVAQLARIAASFHLVRDPLDWFAAMREAPRQAEALREGRLAAVQAMLRREGHAGLRPGQPVLHQGAWLEWMAEPEPRYQLLLPLGRVRAAAQGSVVNRPRPVLALGMGWREFSDGEWVFSNLDQAYLPLPGIRALLAARQADPAFVYFYLAATVRVEEEQDAGRLTSLGWFFDRLPDVQRRWREGRLVVPGQPE